MTYELYHMDEIFLLKLNALHQLDEIFGNFVEMKVSCGRFIT
jgi:hypothetical protein